MRARSIGLLLATLFFASNGLPPSQAWGQSGGALAPELNAIGKILSATGAVTVERTGTAVVQANAPAGGTGRAKAGDLVYQGDLIQTGADGAVAIVFTDDTTFNVT